MTKSYVGFSYQNDLNIGNEIYILLLNLNTPIKYHPKDINYFTFNYLINLKI